MRMSCNGCRVLRKGCSEDCSIRPCLQWIKNPESQANATVFLAKFYGRAGLMNLINAGPSHLRPGIFRSLLYEACGRIVNPIYGSSGLLWSGNWQLCQNAVEAVLIGASITQIGSEAAETNKGPPLKPYDIRHVTKEEKEKEKEKSSGLNDLHRVRTRCSFKRSGKKGKEVNTHALVKRSSSPDSSLSHQSEVGAPPNTARKSGDVESLVAETVGLAEAETFSNENQRAEDGEIELELTLGFKPLSKVQNVNSEQIKQQIVSGLDNNDRVCNMELGLDYPA